MYRSWLKRNEKKGRKTYIPLHALFNWVRWKLTSLDGEFVSSDHESIQLYVLSNYSSISNIYINHCQTHWSLPLGPTLYKFIVMGPLGLDPIHLWTQFENRDPTLYCNQYWPYFIISFILISHHKMGIYWKNYN